MSIPAQLVDLRPRLEAAGMIVVEEPDHLNVRLPFFCSVRVYSDGERLRFESYFGVATRVKSTTLKLGATTVLAVASARLGVGYAGIVALLAIIAGIYDSIRWQLTEHAVTRITTISALAALETSPARRVTGQTASQLLRSGELPPGSPADRIYVRERRDD
jgi:hypothetical protein